MPAPADRPVLSREVMARHQRDRILAAAGEVIAKRGYNSTTVDHIVSAAGIGVGTFYELFENKEGCFLQAYEQIVSEGRDEISKSIDRDRLWPEQAAAALRTLLSAIATRPLDARLALVEIQTAGPAALACHEQTFDGLMSFLAAGRKSSPLASELPATLETAVAGGVLWLLQQRVVMGETEEIEALLPELIAIVVEPYFGEAGVERTVAAAQAAQPATN